MRSIECSGCLREVSYTDILGFLTSNGMPPANIFDILVRSALTAHVRWGSYNVFSTRLYGKYFAEEHLIFKPEQSLYTPTQVSLDWGRAPIARGNVFSTRVFVWCAIKIPLHVLLYVNLAAGPPGLTCVDVTLSVTDSTTK